MLPLIWESAPLYYEPYTGAAAPYHPELRTVPHVYDEALPSTAGIRGLWVSPKHVRNSDHVVAALVVLDAVVYPGYALYVYTWDAGDGSYLGREARPLATGDGGLFLTTYFAANGRDGDLWFSYESLEIRKASPLDYSYAGVSYDHSHFDPEFIWPWAIDSAVGRLIANQSGSEIGVYDLAAGTLIDTIDVGGNAAAIFLEDGSRCYVVHETGVVMVVDYVALEVVGVFRLQLQPGSVNEKRFAWDPSYRRILTLEPTPDEADGLATTLLRAYYPRPLGVGITPPIPARPLRAGRVERVFARVYGDAGEAIAGATVAASLTSLGGTATIEPAKAATGARGYAPFLVRSTGAGDVSVDLASEQE